MRIEQTGQFKKSYKKLHPNQLSETNTAIESIIENPNIGEQKHGDLSWLKVYKFKILGQLTLIGYNISGEDGTQDDNTILTFVALGPHENFYTNIKHTL
jgi:mRNA-degrading endonuclease YafQ of YafQ-DinJ toxin-antitoxin module